MGVNEEWTVTRSKHGFPRPSSMSRLPQPSSSRQKTTTLAPPSDGVPRTRTKSTGPAAAPRSPVRPTAPTTSQPSTPVRSRMQAASKTPVGATQAAVSSPKVFPLYNAPKGPNLKNKTSTSKLSSPRPPSPTKPPGMSMREQIAHKRAEAKKALGKYSPQDAFFEIPPHARTPEMDDDPLGRAPLIKAIAKAKSTGDAYPGYWPVAAESFTCIDYRLAEYIYARVTLCTYGVI